jgi:thymidylate synthase (FAD)
MIKLIEPKLEVVYQDLGENGIYKQIERVGRCCWNSGDKITETSAKPFVEHLINSGHYSPLEHGTVYLKIPLQSLTGSIIDILGNPYTKVVDWYEQGTYRMYKLVTTNLRVLQENRIPWSEWSKYLVEQPTEDFEKRLTFHFTTSISISREYNRHRKNSIMEESTRFCNYAKSGSESALNIYKPLWVTEQECNLLEYFDILLTGSRKLSKVDWFYFANCAANLAYEHLIELGAKPEEAREILPLDTKTELYHTAFISDWIHFCNLRAYPSKGNKPHPEAQILAKQIKDYLIKYGYATAQQFVPETGNNSSN